MTLSTLRSEARERLAEVLDGARTVALVNFPNHGNPGDPAIWLGTRILLRDLGVRVGYSSAHWDFDAGSLRSAVGSAPVLLNGGGNFGDLYLGQQQTRIEVLRTLRDNPVVQLPQSIHFADPANEARMAELLASHPDFRMMVRERNALRIARERLGLEPTLSPDHALALGARSRTRAPVWPVLWLTRLPGDPEHVDHGEPDDPDVRRVEWLHGVPDDEAGWDLVGRLALRVNRAVRDSWSPGVRGMGLRHAAAERTYTPLAWRWVRRGIDLLSSAEVVVTDKLHGHVLCALLGIPHVVLDNSYGKVSGTLDAWTGGLPGVHRAESGEEALALAHRLRVARA
ncbi:exopolysaccharide biosynthesis protein [Actinotalea ferrariae CF5-4]|uniref:Exopolysaccharide biosynthesis protein n=1 Tax=Actinotalea ferrariae CF5-4 TaxID=948458 RepID=A0A021VXN0_9CELL|nr:polysaccharide pyruvyl transferase family protein [Actinotalea ferrariae]EYR64785.1 exopolysaccharide biosynthesis protein [Actinotalea ferrariae CF5-4]